MLTDAPVKELVATSNISDYPQLRHCTFVERNDTDKILMVVGQEYFEITEDFGPREQFLEVKRYLDGRHSIEEISRITGVLAEDIQSMVKTFTEMGLMRHEEPVDRLLKNSFLRRVEDSCVMWSRQIGYHRLYRLLERQEARQEVFLGLLIETYHYVKSAPEHIGIALAHCKNPYWKELLTQYLVEEYDHAELILQALENLGCPRQHIIDAHPIIGAMSLIHMLCEIGRKSTLGYLACTQLFEARREEFEVARNEFERICAGYGYDPKAVKPLIDHMRGDVIAAHSNLLAEALRDEQFVEAKEAHYAVNNLHDLKHAFDQFHDQVLQYYADISNYIPRLRVDYFSL
jgi:TENA/THI-4/PQQC family